MINDNTIDIYSAKYSCMFMDNKFVDLLDEAMKYDKKDGEKMLDIINKIKNNKQFKESLNEGIWDNAQIAHQTAFPLATGNPYQPNFRALDPNSGVPSLQDQGKNNAIAVGTAAAILGVAKIPGVWTALKTALISAVGASGSFLGTVATAAVTLGTAGIMAIISGIVSVSAYLYPRIAKTIKDFKRDGIIAKCEFEADGEKYVAIFSTYKKRWELIYPGSRYLKTKVNVNQVDIKTFFESKFFNKFLMQCKTYLSKVYMNNERIKCLSVLAKMADKQSKKDIEEILNAKTIILNYMFNGQYITESKKYEKILI